MDEDEDRLSNVCADLVSRRRFEPALGHLFRHARFGEWASVAALYRIAGEPTECVPPALAVAWLPSPDPAGPALVVFHEPSVPWALTACYFARERVLNETLAALPSG